MSEIANSAAPDAARQDYGHGIPFGEAVRVLGLATDGVEHLSDQLLSLGLAKCIHARHAARLAVLRRTLRLMPRLAP